MAGQPALEQSHNPRGLGNLLDSTMDSSTKKKGCVRSTECGSRYESYT